MTYDNWEPKETCRCIYCRRYFAWQNTKRLLRGIGYALGFLSLVAIFFLLWLL